MPTKAAFTLSLDCEGLWGMADQFDVVSAGEINQSSLASTYDFVARVLREQEVRATAAFVTAFAVGQEVLTQHRTVLRELAGLVPSWYASVLPALEQREFDGWDGRAFFKRMAAEGHEMAWHGTTHMPLEDDTPDEAVELELELADALLPPLGARPTTIVFPRNRVGHLPNLQRAGFHTYRADRGRGRLNKLTGLAQEWNVFDKAVGDKPGSDNGWCISPPGHFLNWPARVRALVPPSVTVMRWRSLLRAAVANGGYVHMWFHPHNLITAPAMKKTFATIMEEVGQLSRSGDLSILTMHEANQHFVQHKNGSGA